MRVLQIIQTLLFQAILLCAVYGYGQSSINSKIVFRVDENNRSSFDPAEIKEWNAHYRSYDFGGEGRETVPVYSVLPNKESVIYAELVNKSLNPKLLEFRITGSSQSVKSQLVDFNPRGANQYQLELHLPARDAHYSVEVFYNGTELIGKLEVRVYPERVEELIVVPVLNKKIDLEQLESYLGQVFKAANVRFNVKKAPSFDASSFKTITKFNSPSLEYKEYTSQMQEIRDAYFQQFPNFEKEAIYIFVIPGFNAPQIREYAVKGKSLGFVQYQSDTLSFFRSMAKSIGLGCGQLNVSWIEGPKRGSTDNLMDDGEGALLCAWQWDIVNDLNGLHAYYDDYEQVAVDNGRVAFYFWEEDANGNIRIWDNDVMSSIRHPFKRNMQSYHLNIDDYLFQTLWTVWDRNICWWHIIFLSVALGLAVVLKKWLDIQIEKRFARKFFFKFLARVFGLALGIGILIWGFNFIESRYLTFEVKEGPIKELRGMTEFQAIEEVKHNRKMQGKTEKMICSEVLIHKGNNWMKSKRKPVLYFNVTLKSDAIVKCRFDHDSEDLIVNSEKYARKSASQYMVFTFKNGNGEVVKQEVYNHKGNEITSLLRVQDPAKRILLFVNGYRSSVNSNTVEDQVSDLGNKGLELSVSTNLVYSLDRFSYWFWKGFDEKFRERINPSDCFYADGNFSISTSNHRNIKNFLSLMATFPKRCSNENHHVCYKLSTQAKWLSLFKSDKTNDILRKRSNKRGFKKRFENGRIAGRNLHQLLNEIPNKSKNDTLFIVAHSMGYAYALGMVEELRGKINFGGFYIIAPENAEAGMVNTTEWPEVWQFGANFNKGEEEAPCIQDGIAPQSAAKGLNAKHRIFIPKELYKSRGFKQSHFIGLYTYVFDIPAGKKGHVRQH